MQTLQRIHLDLLLWLLLFFKTLKYHYWKHSIEWLTFRHREHQVINMTKKKPGRENDNDPLSIGLNQKYSWRTVAFADLLLSTYQKCLVGTVGCLTASRAPALSRNQTLCSSSNICRTSQYKYNQGKLAFITLNENYYQR